MKVEAAVRDALQELGVQAAEQPITHDQVQTGIRYINMLMESYDYLNLGFTIVSSASDDITIPPYASMWLIKALAVELSPQFGGTSQLPMIVQGRDRAYDNLLLQSIEVGAANYPSRLPTGSGNQCGTYGRRFYPEQPEGINKEDGQPILTEGQKWRT